MHWIGVGILIWIGLAIASTVIALILLSLPFVICDGIGAVIGLATSQSATGFWIGLLLGGLAPYLWYARD